MNKTQDVAIRDVRPYSLSTVDAERAGPNSSHSALLNLPPAVDGWGTFRPQHGPDPNNRQFHGVLGHLAFFGHQAAAICRARRHRRLAPSRRLERPPALALEPKPYHPRSARYSISCSTSHEPTSKSKNMRLQRIDALQQLLDRTALIRSSLEFRGWGSTRLSHSIVLHDAATTIYGLCLESVVPCRA
jgi:hypothetical protein